MSRSQSEKDKKHQEKYQAVLSRLLREEDNKYCVDCDAKGPRWASWNLGLFLCIRCAGIHRNLGVHISKVKSVNLDSWTEEQIMSMESIGNTKARKYYECHLPSNFRRPQTDSPLEQFIRGKYEHKKYVDKAMQQPKSSKVRKEDSKENRDGDKEKRRARKQEKNNIALPRPSENAASVKKAQVPPAQTLAAQAATVTAVQSAPTAAAPPPAQSSNTLDLFGLDTPSAPVGNGDLLGLNTPQKPTTSHISPAHNTNAPAGEPVIEESLFGSEDTSKSASSKTSKESILALYGSSNQSQQTYGVPGGMYIPSQQPNHMMNGYPATSTMQSGMPPATQGSIPHQAGGVQHQASGMPHQIGMQQHQQQPNAGFQNYNAMSMMGGGQQQQQIPAQGMMGNAGGMMGGAMYNQAHIQQQQQQQQAVFLQQQQQQQQQQAQAQALQQVQAQMQNMRVGPGSGMPQQQQPAQQQPAQQTGGWGMPTNPPQPTPAGVGGFGAQQQPMVGAAGSGAGWGANSSGQTLSTNLWK